VLLLLLSAKPSEGSPASATLYEAASVLVGLDAAAEHNYYESRN
jgi:hypothetical protein